MYEIILTNYDRVGFSVYEITALTPSNYHMLANIILSLLVELEKYLPKSPLVTELTYKQSITPPVKSLGGGDNLPCSNFNRHEFSHSSFKKKKKET